MVDVHAFYIRVQAFVKHSDLLSNCPFALKSQNTKKMHLHVICSRTSCVSLLLYFGVVECKGEVRK